LNLSYNNMTGRIPQGNQFLSFPNTSKGNTGLCGNPLTTQCDGPDSTAPTISQEHSGLWQDRLEAILLLTFSGLGFGVGFTLAIMFRRFCHKEGWVAKHLCIRMWYSYANYMYGIIFSIKGEVEL
jgi:hypothetical protein